MTTQDNTTADALSACVGVSLLRVWAEVPLERYVFAGDAVRKFVRSLLLTGPAPQVENHFINRMVLPALRGLASAGKDRAAHRLIDSVSGLSLSEDSQPLRLTVSGQGHLEELRAGLATYPQDFKPHQ